MKATVFAVSLFLLLSFSISISIASAQLTKLTVGYGALSAAQFPAWIPAAWAVRQLVTAVDLIR